MEKLIPTVYHIMIEIFRIPVAAKIDQILNGRINPITTVSYMSYVAFNIL
jgi:hypothetical protein